MSSTTSPVIDLDCTPQRLHRAVSVAVVVALIVALSCMLMMPSVVAPVLAFVIGAGCAAILIAGLWHYGWIGSIHLVRRATWTNTGLWYVVTSDGHRHEALLRPHSRILPMMLWLHWRSGPLRFQVFMFGADISPDVRRRFRARIAFEAVPPAHAFEPPTS